MSERKQPMTDERAKDLRATVEFISVRPLLVRQILEECLVERDRLRDELNQERAVCICGCPMDAHESHGEEGMGCENPQHECVPVCHAAAAIAESLRKESEHHEAEVADLKGQKAKLLQVIGVERNFMENSRSRLDETLRELGEEKP